MIPSQSTKVTYRGDGTTKVFPFNFHYISGNDVKVAIYEIATGISTPLERDYYVNTVTNTVTYPGYAPGQAPALLDQPPVLTSAYKLVIYRETPITQEVDLGDKYPLSTLEQMDDKGILVSQELAEKLERCVKVDVFSEETSEELRDRLFERAKAAETAAAGAAASEANALSYKNAAAASEANALSYKNEAATSAAEASAHETAAASSASSAEEYKTAAAGSASSALEHQTAAATSEANALAYKNAAATSESNAFAYKNAAAASASSAQEYETAAAEYADTALSYKNAAAESAADALEHKTAAAGSAATALEYKTAAGNSASSAQEYKAAAENSAAAANSYKNAAATSESNALAYKNAAAASEANALAYKNDAADSEANALSYKNAAQVSAAAAGNNADIAQNAAASAANVVARVAALVGEDGKINVAYLPAITINNVYTADNETQMNAISTPVIGDICIRNDENKSYAFNGSSWIWLKTPTDMVLSVNGQTGAVNLAIPTNTSDLNNDSGFVDQSALNAAVADFAPGTHNHDDRYYTETEIDTKLNGKANSSHGNHVPTTQAANNACFLRNDNTWQTVTPGNIGAAASNHTHSQYLTSHQDISSKADKSGTTFTGNVVISEGKNIILRPNNSNYTSGIGYDTAGNECFALWAKNTVTRFRWYAGADLSNLSAGSMMQITPDFEISKASGTAKGYIGGTEISVNGHTHSQYLTSHQDISGKANLSGATFTGAISAPTITVTSTLNIPGGKIWIA